MSDTPPLLAPRAQHGTRPASAPRISVLIPAFNAAGTIGAALESALSQQPPPFEVVVSDDGSSDGLETALRPFAAHIRVVSGPNAGLASARNRAAAVAGGQLLALLDADDTWLPGRVAAFAAAGAARPDLAILTTDARVVRDGVPDTETYYASRNFAVEHQETEILRENFIFGAGAVKAAAFWSVGGYSEGVRYAEDWDLWLRLLLRGHRAGLVDLPLYEYRRRADSLTAQKVDLALAVLAMLDRARPLTMDTLQRRQLQRTEQKWRESAANSCLDVADSRTRRMALRAAVGPRATVHARLRFAAAAVAPSPILSRLARDR